MANIVATTKNILITAGDPSGDARGAELIKALKEKDPSINIAVLGGERMKAVCDRFIYNVAAIGASGYTEPLKRFFFWIRLISLVRNYMEEKKPACIITIDFYGLNKQILGLARHRKIPAFYFVSPQVWASRPKRAERLAQLVKRMLVIFPFEKEIYEKVGGKVSFVGHPILDIVPDNSDKIIPKSPDTEWKIGLMPGSRKHEVVRLMPVFWQAFRQIHKNFPKSRVFIFAAKEISDEMIFAHCPNHSDLPLPEIVREDDFAVRRQMDFLITASGTATLENAVLGIPMVVAYIATWLTYHIVKRMILVPYICIVNILAGKPVVKEFIQRDATAEKIAGEVMSMLQNPVRLENMRKEFFAVKNKLGEKGAVKRAADIIIRETFG